MKHTVLLESWATHLCNQYRKDRMHDCQLHCHRLQLLSPSSGANRISPGKAGCRFPQQLLYLDPDISAGPRRISLQCCGRHYESIWRQYL
jgi:hypothetical protein